MRFLYYIIASVVFLSLAGGCKKFVQVDAPYTLTTTSAVYSDASSATAAQVGVYTQMNYLSMPFGIARRTGEYADELTNLASGDATSVALYNNTPNPNTYIGNWKDYYSIIYQVNAVIEGLQHTTAIADTVKRQLLGEAMFSRAYLYFYLVNLYGNVPLLLTTDYTHNATAERTDTSAVYTQMLADCQEAVAQLDDYFVNGTSITSTTERTRPCKSAARALLARIYLYMGNFRDAAAMAGAVIGNAQFSLCALGDVFRKNSTETVWSLEKPSNLYYTSEGYNFILQYISTYGEGQSSCLSPQLLQAFEKDDQRLTTWVGRYENGASTVYYPYKYKEAYTSSPTEYSVMLRLAEQYLIRAEAYARLQDLEAAVADLNVIRRRAGLPAYSGVMEQTAVLTAILHERQVELFTEGGHRWFDLKRTGQADAVMTNVVPAKGGGNTWNTFRKLWPIPQSEINLDPHLQQNVGYN